MIKIFLHVALVLAVFMGCSKDTNEDRKIIIDDASILTSKPELMDMYKKYNEQLLLDYDIDFRVVTTDSDEDINTFSNYAFKMFQDEKGTKSGRALLLVVNTKKDEVRLEVSMALEPVYTDAFISFIETQDMVRFFRDNHIAEGVYASTERMYSRARDAAAGDEFMFDMKTNSIGAGAKTKADLGKKELNTYSKKDMLASSSDSPQEVYEKYLQTRKDHNNNPNLDIFTDDTKKFFAQWTVTPVQADNEVRFQGKCKNKETIISSDTQRAVLISPIKERTCSPYFFKKESGSWKLDFASMNKVIRFNHKMLWHVIFANEKGLDNSRYRFITEDGLMNLEVSSLMEPYLFAFIDYSYDLNGYAYDYWSKATFKLSFNIYKDGIYIQNLHSRGAGAKAGLKRWDKFIKVDGKTIKTNKRDLDYIDAQMALKRSGDILHVEILRKENGRFVEKSLEVVAP